MFDSKAMSPLCETIRNCVDYEDSKETAHSLDPVNTLRFGTEVFVLCAVMR